MKLELEEVASSRVRVSAPLQRSLSEKHLQPHLLFSNNHIHSLAPANTQSTIMR